ncbi:choice-of-anchor M domain-containing protein [Streptomyces sp. 4N509B]|uniref:choice-of-anchor M domain-containing protein n=1 Tax=Streptomyces sp. 4N509B TaxID=3457413 RepID=UPI003FD2DBC3
MSRPTRPLARALSVAGGIAATLSCAVLVTPAAALQPTELSRGHVDVLGVELTDGAFHVHVHDEVNGVEYEPSDVVLRVSPAAAHTVPSGTCHAFLGAPGDTVHRLPEVENPELLWPGLSAHIEDGVLAGDELTVSLTAVSGPGDVSVYANSLCPADTRILDSGDGLDGEDAATLDAHDHLHANWAFTEPGDYALTFTVTGTLADGTEVPPATAELAVSVG